VENIRNLLLKYAPKYNQGHDMKMFQSLRAPAKRLTGFAGREQNLDHELVII